MLCSVVDVALCVLMCATGLMLVEKLMSGLYMGENARRILLSFARDSQLFGGFVPEPLTKEGSFTTAGEQLVVKRTSCRVLQQRQAGPDPAVGLLGDIACACQVCDCFVHATQHLLGGWLLPLQTCVRQSVTATH